MSKFQIIVLAFFVVALVAGAAAFALYKGGGSGVSNIQVTVWGTFPKSDFDAYMSDLATNGLSSLKVNYSQFTSDTFSDRFVKALATQTGPDAILVSADMILTEENKLTLIPYEALSRRDYLDSYVEEAEVYLTDAGIRAIPFSIDPLVMFWNRDIFNATGLATYPKTWEEFTGNAGKPGLVQKMLSKDANGNIRKTALALGDFSNITNAREILGSMMLQGGNPVTMIGNDGLMASALRGISRTVSLGDVLPAIAFFSQFLNPIGANYSWNRAMPNDKTAFLSGNLGVYFGLASELRDLRNKNPNLNFDIAPLPQFSGRDKAVYARLFGFSIVSSSANQNSAFQAIATLTDPDNIKLLSDRMYIPSVRREVITAGSSDPYITIFNQAALIGRTWLDVHPTVSKRIFGDLIQSITSGQRTPEEAVRSAHDLYDYELKRAGS